MIHSTSTWNQIGIDLVRSFLIERGKPAINLESNALQLSRRTSSKIALVLFLASLAISCLLRCGSIEAGSSGTLDAGAMSPHKHMPCKRPGTTYSVPESQSGKNESRRIIRCTGSRSSTGSNSSFMPHQLWKAKRQQHVFQCISASTKIPVLAAVHPICPCA